MTPSALHYPFGSDLPATGRAMRLRPGVRWVRMPLPFALNHINLWMLDDDAEGTAGWTLVDAGIAVAETQKAWQSVWDQDGQGLPLLRMLVTHMHPDHLGNAHWLIEQFSARGQPARLWMSAADHLAAQIACKETTGYGGERAARYFLSHGLQNPVALDKIRQRGGYYSAMVPEVPRVYRRLMHDMIVPIGQRPWRCIVGYGHAPEHMSLFDEHDGILISGDMLLPKISTNISVIDLEPEADALGLFLASLDRLTQLPADTLVLPSHGLPFVGVHARVAELHAHHEARLSDVLQACRQGPQTAAQIMVVLFKRELDLHQTTFAMGEAVAHLNYLWHRGQVKRFQAPDGVWYFEV